MLKESKVKRKIKLKEEKKDKEKNVIKKERNDKRYEIKENQIVSHKPNTKAQGNQWSQNK